MPGTSILAGRSEKEIIMLQLLTRYRWAFGLRGVLSILYGLFLVLAGDLSLHSFVITSGLFILIESLLLLIITLGRNTERTHMIFIEGILGCVVTSFIILGSGIGSLIVPFLTSIMFPIYIGTWALVTGVFGLIHTVGLRSKLHVAWVLMLSSLLSFLCGAWLIVHRETGALSLRGLIATFVVLYGVLQIILIFRARLE